MAPTKTKPADLNKDGQVTKRERRQYRQQQQVASPAIDQLSREELAAQYQSAVGIIYSVPEIRGVFEQALNEGWTPDRFQAAVQNSDWFRSNDEYARIAWARETMGGADWDTSLQDAANQVRVRARNLGAELSEQEVNSLARRYLYEGWGESTRQMLLDQALSEEISFVPDERGTSRLMGGAADLQDSLRTLALANGVDLTDNWYLSAAKSVASGLTDPGYWERDIREQAASRFPGYREKIMMGMNTYDLANPYIKMMSSELEIDPFSINLDDPYIIQALGNTDEQGNFSPMNLWDFQKKIRQDPRWENTSKAQNEITSTTGRIMQMFGLMGG